MREIQDFESSVVPINLVGIQIYCTRITRLSINIIIQYVAILYSKFLTVRVRWGKTGSSLSGLDVNNRQISSQVPVG